MTRDVRALIERVEAYSLDQSGEALPFSERLARENRWSREHALRVVREYKRFVVLAVTTDDLLAPSEDVDQAWHLHLIDTVSYWNCFCSKVLGCMLHHRPSGGGTGERARYAAAYRRTLDCYHEVFGHPPPADIWPQAAPRFRTGIEWDFLALVAVGSVSACGVGATTDFALEPLGLLGFVWVATTAMACLVQRHFDARYPRVPEAIPELDPYETAYLTGGRRGVLRAAIASLIADGALELTPDPEPLRVRLVPGSDAHPIEQLVFAQVPAQDAVTFEELLDEAQKSQRLVEALDDIAQRLEKLGLIRRTNSLGALELALAAPALGLVWVALAGSRGKTDLIVFSLATAGVAIWRFCAHAPWIDRRRTLLAELRQRLRPERGTPYRSLLRPCPPALTVALFGVAELAVEELPPDLASVLGPEPPEDAADAKLIPHDDAESIPCGCSCGGE